MTDFAKVVLIYEQQTDPTETPPGGTLDTIGVPWDQWSTPWGE
jgi:hypothetical protein